MDIQQEDARYRQAAGTLVICLMDLASMQDLKKDHFELFEGEAEKMSEQLRRLSQLMAA